MLTPFLWTAIFFRPLNASRNGYGQVNLYNPDDFPCLVCNIDIFVHKFIFLDNSNKMGWVVVAKIIASQFENGFTDLRFEYFLFYCFV